LDADYQLRCIDCPQHTSDDPEREIALLDGEFDFTVNCSIQRVDGKRSMTLSARHDTGRDSQTYGFRILRANVDDKDQSDECRIRITEGANIYEGACTGDDPDENMPCKVSFDRKGEIIEGTMYCDKIPNMGNLTSYRYLVSPGSSDRSAKFAVHNCTGI
jgi:hypothetical protein